VFIAVRARYRVRQFGRTLGAHPAAADLRAARAALSAEEWTLFRGMSPRDQWHSIETWRLLEREGFTEPALRTAALLHDAGKGRVRLHERVLFVLLARAPAALERLAAANAPGTRGALHRIVHHAEAGASLAAAAGAPPRTVELIRRHHNSSIDEPELAALIRADERA